MLGEWHFAQVTECVKTEHMRSVCWLTTLPCPSSSPILWRKSRPPTSRACQHLPADQPPRAPGPVRPHTWRRCPDVIRTLPLKTPAKQRPWGRGFYAEDHLLLTGSQAQGGLAASLTLSATSPDTCTDRQEPGTEPRGRSHTIPHTGSLGSSPCPGSSVGPTFSLGPAPAAVNLGAFSIALG